MDIVYWIATVILAPVCALAQTDVATVVKSVPNVCARFPEGNVVHNPPVALSWEDFQSIKNVVAVVCGLDKKNAILGALRTGLISRLIIDDQTVLALLEERED